MREVKPEIQSGHRDAIDAAFKASVGVSPPYAGGAFQPETFKLACAYI
jgi:hypothetical protein